MSVETSLLFGAPRLYRPTAALSMDSFFNRQGTKKFEDPEQGGRKYLPQVNEWSVGTILWNCERAGGLEHVPVWEAYPVCTYIFYIHGRWLNMAVLTFVYRA